MGAAPLTFVAEISPRKASGAALSIYRNSGDVGLLLGPVLSGLAVDFSKRSRFGHERERPSFRGVGVPRE